MSAPGILAAFAGHAAERPGADALVSAGGAVSWLDFTNNIRACAGRLVALGTRPGDRIAILAANGPQAITAYFGAVAAGACAVPFPTSLRPEGIAGLLADCAPRVILADGAGAALLGEMAVPIVPLDGALFGGDPVGAFAEPPPEAPFNIIYSSGTTGTPKGIVHSNAMRNGQAARRIFALGPSSRMLLSTPIYSNTTLLPMLCALYQGGAVQLMPKFDAREFLRIVQDWRATHTMLVPVQYRRIMDVADFDAFDLTSMQVKQSTSAVFDADLKADVLKRFPGILIEIYGLTEGGVSCVLNASENPDRLDTVGRAADGVELRLIDAEGREVGQGEVGEITGRSPYMMSGYHGRPDLTEAFLWRDPGGRVFFRSGDLGTVGPDDFVRIVGRRKEMINSGGFNIYPVDLESALLSHPAVSEAAVFPIPSRKWGETPFAAVVLKAGEDAEAKAILDWANARLGRMQRIDGVAIRVDLPRSSIGKVQKQQLAEDYRDRAST